MYPQWSNLPIELLTKIKDELNHNDILRFRSVCSNWSLAVPIPTTLPRYNVHYNEEDNEIDFTTDSDHPRISLPLSSDIPLISLFRCYNGWLVFKEDEIEILHLFDPVRKHMLVFPRMTLELFQTDEMLEPNVLEECEIRVTAAVVSSSAEGDVTVSAIVHLDDGSYIKERMLVFCRYGYDQNWSPIMEEIEDMVDIIIARDGRIMAINEDCEIFILTEWPPMMILKRFKVMLPNHFLENELGINPNDKRGLIVQCCSMEEIEGSYLKIEAYCPILRIGGDYITFKLDMKKLFESKNRADIICDEIGWDDLWPHRFHRGPNFIPLSIRQVDHVCKKIGPFVPRLSINAAKHI